MSTLTASQVHLSLGGREVLRGVDASIAAGELVGLIGPNGAGKTTLLRLLAGIRSPDRGSIDLDGTRLGRMDARARARQIGYLPQDGTIHWRIPVRELVLTGRLPHNTALFRRPPEDLAHADRALAAVDAGDLADRPATELSGGERARVLLARALAGAPEFLLADEPVAGLDPYHRIEVMDHFAQLTQAGTAIVIVLHDLTLAARYCNRLILLHEGSVAADGDVDTVLSDENLAAVYRVQAERGARGGTPFIVPWERLTP